MMKKHIKIAIVVILVLILILVACGVLWCKEIEDFFNNQSTAVVIGFGGAIFAFWVWSEQHEQDLKEKYLQELVDGVSDFIVLKLEQMNLWQEMNGIYWFERVADGSDLGDNQHYQWLKGQLAVIETKEASARGKFVRNGALLKKREVKIRKIESIFKKAGKSFKDMTTEVTVIAPQDSKDGTKMTDPPTLKERFNEERDVLNGLMEKLADYIPDV